MGRLIGFLGFRAWELGILLLSGLEYAVKYVMLGFGGEGGCGFSYVWGYREMKRLFG